MPRSSSQYVCTAEMAATVGMHTWAITAREKEKIPEIGVFQDVLSIRTPSSRPLFELQAIAKTEEQKLHHLFFP